MTRQPEEVADRLRQAVATFAQAAAWDWALPDGPVIGDAQFAVMFGVSEPDATAGIPAQSVFARIHVADRIRIRLALGAIARGAQSFSKEFRLVRPDGAVRWVHGRGICITDAEEQPVRFTGALVDITEQKRAEESLRIAQAAGGIGTFEFVGGFGTASASAQFCRLLGLQPARDIPLRTVNAVVLPGDPPLIDRVPGSQPAPSVETRIRRPDTGEVRWLVRRGEYLRDTDTSELRFSGVIYDITDAKQVEEQLRTLGQTLEARVEERTRERDRAWKNSRDLQAVFDAAGRVQAANEAWTTILGWEEGEVVGWPILDFIDEADRPAMRDALAAATELPAFENRCRHKDGGLRWISWVTTAEHGLIYASGRHVTAEREAAHALAAVQEQLRQAQKMEAVGQLTGGLAHDFNNLLTGISGSIELMQTRLAQGRAGEVGRYLAAAQASAKRAAALTHRLLAFSRRQTLDPKPTNVERLIRGMEELIQRTVGPEIQLEVGGAAAVCLTLIDANQLENALLNLSINARDAMPDGGRLTIATATLALDDRGGSEQDLAPGDYVSISVTDTGTGMPPEVVARAYDPFFTTKPLGQGTGLGLSMTYGFVRQSGGQIRITSEVGRGTTVQLLLPRFEGEEALQDGQAAAALPKAGRGETVLLVDDEAAIRMLVAEVLQDLGYHVIEAADGPAGIEVLRSDCRVDLLVSDVGLPGGVNGRQVADAGRAARPRLKVLFITGYAEGAAFDGFRLDSDMQVLTKPFTLDVLAMRIKGLLTGIPLAVGGPA